MTPGSASASGFCYDDTYAWEGEPFIDDSDLLSGYGVERGSSSVSTSRWGNVSLVQPDALEFPLALYFPEHDFSPLPSTPLSFTSLFNQPPNGGAGVVAPLADIGLLPVSEARAISPPGDNHQLPASERAYSPEPAQKLPRKRPCGVEQAIAPAAPKKPADRMVEIAGFRWTLPPDPGEAGPYPNLTFLIGAAISSSVDGRMTLSEIRQWIGKRYPSGLSSAYSAISCILSNRADFINTRTHKWSQDGAWTLRNPQGFRSCYEESIYLQRRPRLALERTVSSTAGTTVFPADIGQLAVSNSAHSPASPQQLSRKLPREVEQAVALPAEKKTADRTVQIAGFSWTLPPDPGKDGPYPSLTFLIGAALSSSESGIMKLDEICQWIRSRYPSRPISADSSIAGILGRGRDFINIRGGKGHVGLWQLCNPHQFRCCYEQSINLKRRAGITLVWSTRKVQPASEQEQGAAAPALSVKIGGYILMLPPYSAGQRKPPLRLLCGCAIALGSEQGASVTQITEWIAGRYFVTGMNAIRALGRNIRATLSSCGSGFRRTNNPAPAQHKGRYIGMRWVLENPAGFAASYGGCVCSQASSNIRKE